MSQARDVIYTANSNTTVSPVLWLKADKGITLSGNTVSAWNDQSGNGYNATQTTQANQPLYVKNALNGKPVLRFDNSGNDVLLFSSTINFSEYSIFAVAKTLDQGTLVSTILGRVSSADGFFGLTKSLVGISNNPYNPLSVGIPDNLNPILISAWYDSAILNIKTSIYYTNGGRSGIFTFDNIGHLSSTGNNMKGDIAEIIIYNSALSNQDRLTVENYLNQKYNLY